MGTKRRVRELDPAEKEVIRRFRKALDDNQEMTQADVARKLGTTRIQVNRWYNGHEMPAASNLIRLPEILHVSATWLIQGIGPMYGFPGQSADALDAVRIKLGAVQEALLDAIEAAEMSTKGYLRVAK